MATASVVNSPTTESIQNENLSMSSDSAITSSSTTITTNSIPIKESLQASENKLNSCENNIVTKSHNDAENKPPISKEVATKPSNSFILSANNDATDLISGSNQIHQPAPNTLNTSNAIIPRDQIHVNDPLRQNSTTTSNVPSIINTSKTIVPSSLTTPSHSKIVSGRESITALQAALSHHNVVGTVTHHFHPGTIPTATMPGLLSPRYGCLPPHLGRATYAAKSKSALFFSNLRLRRGKWTLDEENYANHLISEFEKGTLADCDNGSTLRSYLAQKLHCAPMRISKKYAGKSIGKHVFLSRTRGKSALSHQIDRARLELENRFLRSLEEETNASLGQHEQIQKGMIFGSHPPNPLTSPHLSNNFGATPPMFQNNPPPPPQSNPHAFSGMMLSFPSYQQGQWNPYPASLSSTTTTTSACSSISHPSFDLSAASRQKETKFTPPPPISVNPALFPNNQSLTHTADVIPGKIIFNGSNGMTIANNDSSKQPPNNNNPNGTNDHTIYHQKLVNTGNIVPGTILFSTNNGVKAIPPNATPSSNGELNFKTFENGGLPDVLLSTGDSYAPLSSPTYNIDDKYQSETFTTCSFDEYHKFLGTEFPGMYNPPEKAAKPQHQAADPQQQPTPPTPRQNQSPPHPHIPFHSVNSVTSDVYAHFAQQSMLAVSQHSAYCRGGIFKPNDCHLIAPENKTRQTITNENAPQQQQQVDKTTSSSSSSPINSQSPKNNTTPKDTDPPHRFHKRPRPSSPTNNSYLPSSQSTTLPPHNRAAAAVIISGSERSNSDRESVRGSSRASSENSGTDSTTGSENASDNDGSDELEEGEEVERGLSPKRAKVAVMSGGGEGEEKGGGIGGGEAQQRRDVVLSSREQQ